MALDTLSTIETVPRQNRYAPRFDNQRDSTTKWRWLPEQNYATCVMMNVGGNEASNAAIEINLLLVEALRNANYNPRRLFAEPARRK